ncbi:GNAT family N-acetyltransferase [Kribbella sp. NPDC048915]|uniref:GNAT family N-acetyltransferase n=1 Tax=Kribbella sp. NPDC048915 TaxID=3155148 RepID=UPI0033CF7166
MSGFAEYRPGTVRRRARVDVRPAEIADLDACAELTVARTGGSAAERRQRLEADLGDPERYAVVPAIHGTVVGYGGVIRHVVSATDPPSMAPAGYYLVGLIVAHAWRRHGIGELLTRDRMEWVADRADRADRADEVYYFANLANRPTLDLHHSLRFVEVTRDFTFPGDPLKPGTGVLLRADLQG